MKTPPELHFPTPNFTTGHEKRRFIVIHSTRSGQPWATIRDWQPTLNWFANPASQVSAHVVVGVNVGRLVANGDTAWHASELNPISRGIELLQPTMNHAYIPVSIDLAAWLAAGWCIEDGIPPIHTPTDQGGATGIIGHEETTTGRANGKSDPGTLKFPWPRFIRLVQMYVMQGTLEPMQCEGDYLDVVNALRYVGAKL